MGFMDLFKKDKKKEINTGINITEGGLFSKDEITQIWNSYGTLRTMVSLKQINNMEDVIASMDKVVPSIVAGKTGELSDSAWKGLIKGYYKFYIIFRFYLRSGDDEKLRKKLGTEMDNIAESSLLLIHKFNEQHPDNPIFYELLMAEAYEEKFIGSPIQLSIMGGVSILAISDKDEDRIKQGLAAERYIVERVLKEKVHSNRQGDYGDESWKKISKAVESYQNVWEKLNKGDYATLNDEEWDDLFTIWAACSFELENNPDLDMDKSPFNHALFRANGYSDSLAKVHAQKDIADGYETARKQMKDDVRIESRMEDVAKLEIQYAENSFSQHIYYQEGTPRVRSVTFLAIIHAGTRMLIDEKMGKEAVEELEQQIKKLLESGYSLEMKYYTTSPRNHASIKESDAISLGEWELNEQVVPDYEEKIRNELSVITDEEKEVKRMVKAISKVILSDCENNVEPRFYMGTYANLHNYCSDVEGVIG